MKYDPILTDALKVAMEYPAVTSSILQRALNIGYARASGLVDAMKELGVIESVEGFKPRTVLMTSEQLSELCVRLASESDNENESVGESEIPPMGEKTNDKACTAFGSAADNKIVGRLDPLLIRAAEIVVETQTATTSYLQRYLEIGYGRAAKLIDAMEKWGIITPPNETRRREVLMTREQFLSWRAEREKE